MQRESPGMYFVISGEHPTLPKAELTAILDSKNAKYEVTDSNYKLLEVRAQDVTPYEVAKRAGYTEEAGLRIFKCSPTYESIASHLDSSPINDYLAPKERFSVRVARFGGASPSISRTSLEPFLGDLLVKKTSGKVDLRSPTKQFRGVITGGAFHFGLLTYQRPRASIANRRPRKRPAFHPSTMVPKLARCMVNLSGATEGSTFLDPFCGVGGIALEACLVGCEVIGMDAKGRMVRGTRRNLAHFKQKALALIKGDAREIPLTRVDAIATDPPYGTQSSTFKSSTRKILEDFLPRARALLPAGNRAVIASPLGTRSSQVAEESGFKVLDRHLVYVHRSLTREILALGAS
jgi:tRNA (guanine10-N2)-dimethyltransferase